MHIERFIFPDGTQLDLAVPDGYEKLVAEAAEAQERFGDDELERFAREEYDPEEDRDSEIGGGIYGNHEEEDEP